MSLKTYDLYKESGIAWLGKVPATWKVAAIKHGFDIKLGKMLQPDLKGEDDILAPYVRAANIQWKGVDATDVKQMWFSPQERAELALQENDLLVSEGGDVGRACLWKNELEECYFQNSVNRARSKPGNSPIFGRYWLSTLKDKGFIDVICNKSTIAHYTAEKLAATPALLPPHSEQVAIANFLDRETAKIDTLIAEQQRLIELLQEKRQAVISHAVTKGLNPNVPMKDSGVEWLGEVPEHWDVLPCRAFLNERDSRNGDYSNDYYLSLVAGRGVIPYDEKGDIGNKKPEDLGKCKLVHKGDFVINSMNYGIGSYGVSAYYGVCSPVYIVVTPNEDLAHAGFAFRVLENKWFQRYAQSFGNGILAHRCAISWDILKNINAGIPPAEEQMKILSYLDEGTRRYEQLTNTALEQVSLLQERRSALISAAVTGQIDVRGLATEEEL